jgi:hypothetical protein
VRSQSTINHILGIDVGYSSYPKYVAYKGEIGLNYLFSYKNLGLGYNVDVAPATNFGKITKYSLMAGYTTKISKNFSWHLLFGGMLSSTSVEDYYINPGDFYNFGIRYFCLSTGAYYKIGEGHFLLGINALVSFYEENEYFLNYRTGHYTSRSSTPGPFITGKISINYLFNKDN